MKSVVHISADFPDPLVPGKTRAVENLLAATEGFRHIVYSLNRVSWKSEVASLPFGEDRTAIAYGAPPYGIMLERFLIPVAENIARDLEVRGITPALVHAHKFSIEGLVAARISELIDVPFVASLWGDTDIKIVDTKSGMRRRYRRLARQALRLLPAAPWTQAYFREALALDNRHFQILPVMTAGDAIMRPVLTHPPRLISVFALDAWRRKGLDVLLRALADVARSRPDIVLDIYGRGSPKSLFEVTRLIEGSEVGPRVRLKGPLAHHQVQRKMNGYTAFVMAPRRETYGMVHVEAVLAGVPILWAQGRGIDGLFDGHNVGVRCDPNSPASVAEGIRQLLSGERRIKDSIDKLQGSGLLEPLRREGIAAGYAQILSRFTNADAGTLKPVTAAAAR
jgi:glycosyltransferase involved in cell wall biosynthesis